MSGRLARAIRTNKFVVSVNVHAVHMCARASVAIVVPASQEGPLSYLAVRCGILPLSLTS